MVDVSFAEWEQWISTFLWPFFRVSSFFLIAPIFGHSSIPPQVKLGLAAVMAMIIGPLVSVPTGVPIFSWASFGIIVEQMLVGVGLGLMLAIMLAVVQAAGEYISLQMGLGFATFFQADAGTNTVIVSRILYMVTLLLFLSLNGHLVTIDILIATFNTIPIGGERIETSAFEIPARYAGTVFSSGLLLALPLIAPLLIVKLTLGILNRAAPQFSVFSVGFPMSLIVGMVLLVTLMRDMGRFVQSLFREAIEWQEQLIGALAGLL